MFDSHRFLGPTGCLNCWYWYVNQGRHFTWTLGDKLYTPGKKDASRGVAGVGRSLSQGGSGCHPRENFVNLYADYRPVYLQHFDCKKPLHLFQLLLVTCFVLAPTYRPLLGQVLTYPCKWRLCSCSQLFFQNCRLHQTIIFAVSVVLAIVVFCLKILLLSWRILQLLKQLNIV